MAFVGLKKVLNDIHRMRLLGNKTTVLIYYTLSISLLSYVSSLFEYVERFEELKLTYSKHLLRNGWAANKDTIWSEYVTKSMSYSYVNNKTTMISQHGKFLSLYL